MVYKYHQKWRDAHPEDSSVWDIYDLNPEEKKLVKNMRKSKPVIPYTLEVECTSYWGNFEREFLGYSIGILDDCQMGLDHSDKERALFWKEVFNREAIDFEEASESYELYKDYLLETYQECDDWEQLTFYTIDWNIYHKNGSNVLKIQLTKPLSRELEEIIIPRMRAFFSKKIYEYLKPEDLGKLTQDLLEVAIELDARERSCNVVHSDWTGTSWKELCDMGTEILRKLRN